MGLRAYVKMGRLFPHGPSTRAGGGFGKLTQVSHCRETMMSTDQVKILLQTLLQFESMREVVTALPKLKRPAAKRDSVGRYIVQDGWNLGAQLESSNAPGRESC
jgi:hypothetical protein